MKKIILLSLFLNLSCATSWADTYKVGPAYSDDIGKIAVVIEMPKGVAPKTTDFQLQLNRQPVGFAKYLEPFAETEREIALVICVDVRGSVTKQTIKEVKESLIFLTGMAGSRPTDKIALITFSDHYNVASSFEKRREYLFGAILSLEPRGSETHAYQALNTALDLLNNQYLPKRRRIILISNGNDPGSIETMQHLTSRAKRMKVPIDVLGDGGGDRYMQEGLSAIAEMTGGEFVKAVPGITSLKDGMEGLYDDLYQYRSWMVYFSYEAALHGSKTKNAAISISQPGKTAMIAELPGRYSPPRSIEPTVPDEDTATPSLGESEFKNKQLPPHSEDARYRAPVAIIVSAIIIALVLLVYLFHRRRNKKTLVIETNYSSGLLTARETIVDPAPRRMTLVGGFVFPPPEPQKPCAVFIGTEGFISGNRYSMEKELFSVGQADGNDMVISEDDQLSRQHAFFRYEKGNLFVYDRNSGNGTYVNSNKLSETGVALEPGDKIRLGGSTVEVAKPPL